MQCSSGGLTSPAAVAGLITAGNRHRLHAHDSRAPGSTLTQPRRLSALPPPFIPHNSVLDRADAGVLSNGRF